MELLVLTIMVDTAVLVLLVILGRTARSLAAIVPAHHARMELLAPVLPLDILVHVIQAMLEEIVMLQLLNAAPTLLVKMEEPAL